MCCPLRSCSITADPTTGEYVFPAGGGPRDNLKYIECEIRDEFNNDLDVGICALPDSTFHLDRSLIE